jgi:hypothetical protein
VSRYAGNLDPGVTQPLLDNHGKDALLENEAADRVNDPPDGVHADGKPKMPGLPRCARMEHESAP